MLTKKKIGFCAAGLWLLACGCHLLYPQQIVQVSRLLPVSAASAQYALESDGAVSYTIEDLRLLVRHLSDPDLNAMFPTESSEGEYSINPYTFGDYVDPTVGYVRNRFTVFEIEVHNRAFAKVELNPLKAVLLTDRGGEFLQPYGILAGSSPRNFESYYRARRSPSGNDFYRFNMRMGIVRSNNYNIDRKIFKGESYRGLLVFDPLADEVAQVALVLRDFVLKFNPHDAPLETTTLRFEFQREVQRELVERERDESQSGLVTYTRLGGPLQLEHSATGNPTRAASALEGELQDRLPAINACFAREFAAGRAAAGRMKVRFAIDSTGAVAAVEIVDSGVVSAAVDTCVRSEMERWTFAPAEGRTVAECDLEFIDGRE